FYRITGKGKPVVLIHGFGEDGNIWDKQVDFLQNQFQLIVPDLPGSGKSGVISSQSAVGMEEYAEIIKAILVEEKIEKSTMLGHSLGGYITLAFAEKYPDMLSSFGLVHSTAFADSEEKKAARLKSIEFIKKYGAYDFLRTTIPGLFSKQWSQDHLPEIETLVEKGKNFSSEALIQYYQAMINRPDRTAVLKNFSKPILFIIGEQDNAVPFAQSMQQCYLPVQSHIHILRNSAHMGMLEETAATNNFLLGFLQ
ncbi:MAG TPA: alpha/beta hydrolase, partial [Ferruginibacter sp.]|nr:alpha/beta hydrolase [Ferruginibacter sp.]